MANIREIIGAELRALRLSRGLTTRELAEMAQVGQSHIVRIEAGKYNLRVDTASRIAAALGAEFRIIEKEQPG